MMDTVWRLAWALPLVLMVGVAAVLMLRRFVVRTQPTTAQIQRMSTRESVALSDDTRVHLLEVDGKLYLIVESARQAVLQPLLQADEVPHASRRFGTSWLQPFQKSRSR